MDTTGEERASGDEIERLSHERDFWKSMFTQLVAEYPEGILVTTEAGAGTPWNQIFADHMNIPRSEALGEHEVRRHFRRRGAIFGVGGIVFLLLPAGLLAAVLG